MDTRRDFLKKAGLLSAGLGMQAVFPASIQKALAINPDEGSTFYDAEHVVFLMQENRSFDHCFGSLQGVRGFNDPRAIRLPNKNPVWLQSNNKGETYAPFRLDIKNTKATWMGDLPHSWENQVDARNNGKYDNWLEAKKLGKKEYQHVPLTLGYYTRKDIPFYYALADGFTVFDQHFCSSLTGTTSNRLFFWTGKLRDTPLSPACVRNSDVYYNKEAHWKTFPERLEENGISWRIYQNEISLRTNVEDASLLANFTDNNLEWFSQYHVRFSEGYRKYLLNQRIQLPKEIAALESEIKQLPKGATQALTNKLENKIKQLKSVEEDLIKWSPENFEKLSTFEKNLHKKAFTTNINDENYHKIETIDYLENGEKRQVDVPKGDILYQFRNDVDNGKLPMVSWLVAPQKFSDHPSAPWYGAWYVSEIMDILTKNPEVWKKTIFVVTYDENDGYFDHIPPFTAPHPKAKNAISEGIDASTEYVSLEEELNRPDLNPDNARESPVGLGYRVPMLIASPWSRGGRVNSEVCDISSTLLFLEKFLKKKTGKDIVETNISSWRRTICGDLTSAFQTFNGTPVTQPKPLNRDEFMKVIKNASFKALPSNFKALSRTEIEAVNKDPKNNNILPKQEPGIRDSCALPYELYVEGALNADKKTFSINFTSSKDIFGNTTKGAPFNVYAPGEFLQKNKIGEKAFAPVKTWAYAVKSGDSLTDSWEIDHFKDEKYQLQVYGPNGFFREFIGDAHDPDLILECTYEKARGFIKKLTGVLELKLTNRSKDKDYTVVFSESVYRTSKITKTIKKRTTNTIKIATTDSYGWYDFHVAIEGASNFKRHYAGRVETGKTSKTDPNMGGLV